MSTQRRSRLLFVAALAAALIGAMLLPATAAANAHKVDICHLRDDGTFKVLSVSVSAEPAHVAHGDLLVGESVDANCQKTLLAVAYSNLDGKDGFSPDGADVLIAKVVDIDGDGLPSKGDKVVTNQYPKDLSASTFGTFAVQEHLLSGVTSSGATPLFVEVTSDQGEFIFEDSSGREAYSEEAAQPAVGFSFFSDSTSGADALVTNPGSPSQPSQPGIGSDESEAATDDPFIDVDIFVQ